MPTSVLKRIKSTFFTRRTKSVPPPCKRNGCVDDEPRISHSPEPANVQYLSPVMHKDSGFQETTTSDGRTMTPTSNSGSVTSNGHVPRKTSAQQQRKISNYRRANTMTNVITSLSEFDRVCTIGTGTFGRVYLVRNKCTSSFYALKVLHIAHIIQKHQVEHVHNEKRVLEFVTHPNIIQLHWTFHDDKCIYMMFDYIAGGELFSYLRAAGKFGNATARFYIAELTLALEYLHKESIIYRDLKPENLLLDSGGHLKLIDFGFSKIVHDRTWTLCGTPEYLAPEIIKQRGYTKAVDWWGVGVLVYEMLTGDPPFTTGGPQTGNSSLSIYEQIVEAKLHFPRNFNMIAKDLVRRLLQPDVTMRLGCQNGGVADIKGHRWFSRLNWEQVQHHQAQPPIVPTLYHAGDTGNYDSYKETDMSDLQSATEDQIDMFRNF